MFATTRAQDGALDLSFDAMGGANYSVVTIAVQPDGRILIGGNFGCYAGIGRNRIARLINDITTATPSSTPEETFFFPNPSNGVFSFASPITG